MLRPVETTLRYWHLLSLDAPTVAALWCWAFGRAAGLRLAPWLPLALALGTWLFYIADRLLDARLAPPSLLRERHRFHHRHRRAFLAAAAPVALLLALLVSRMPTSLLAGYCVLGTLSLLYLALIHLPARAGASRRFPKELAVALLFAAASALPAWNEARLRAAGLPRPHPLLLLCPIFAMLCWLNCIAIEDWEQHAHTGHARSPRVLGLAGLAIAAAILGLFGLAGENARSLALLAAISAAFFLALDPSRLTVAARRIAADLALLTPLALVLATRLWR